MNTFFVLFLLCSLFWIKHSRTIHMITSTTAKIQMGVTSTCIMWVSAVSSVCLLLHLCDTLFEKNKQIFYTSCTYSNAIRACIQIDSTMLCSLLYTLFSPTKKTLIVQFVFVNAINIRMLNVCTVVSFAHPLAHMLQMTTCHPNVAIVS